jgi:hypothetical protein
MQPQKKAYVKQEKNLEKQPRKETTDTRLLTRSEQLEKLADIIIDIYNQMDYATKKEPASRA